MNTFETKAGRVLTLKPIKATMLRHLLSKFGNLGKIFADPKSIKDNPKLKERLKGRAGWQAMSATDQLFNYCAGFGVTTDPTEDELDELAEMNFRVDKPHLARVSWLRFFLEDDEEAGNLMGAVMLLTLAPDDEEDEEEETPIDDDKNERIAALEAQVAALEGEGESDENGS